jgi:NTE family protein
MPPAAEGTSDPTVRHNALVLGGGGARAAYQAGVLQYVGEAFPNAPMSILTGVSAGSINAAHLADDPVSWNDATRRLAACWTDLCTQRVVEPRSLWTLGTQLLRGAASPQQSLLDTRPLRVFLRSRLRTGAHERLTGVRENLNAGRLRALALSTSNYATMQTVTWTEGCAIENWARPNRIGRQAELTLDHVMASAALPLLFPAVQLDDAWHGDGGIRLLDPLAPAIHLGADRLFVISTRYERSRSEADTPSSSAYPSPLQIAGMLVNVLMLDLVEHDAAVLRRINRLVRRLRPEERGRLRPIDLLIIRPSVDLGALAQDYTLELGRTLGTVLNVLRDRQQGTPDWLSMLLFEPGYIERLLEIGYADARRQHERIGAFFARPPAAMPSLHTPVPGSPSAQSSDSS